MVWCEIRPTRARATDPAGSGIPEMRALPDVGLSRPANTRSSVVFPAPFGPNSARHSPAPSEKVTPATANRDPNARVSSTTSTIGDPDWGILVDIRLELATLARAAQNRVSFEISPAQ